MARRRSPNYPKISLPAAIELARKVYRKEDAAKVEPIAVAKDLGYAGLNGSSLGIISALKKYGLLVEEGKQLRISHDAIIILEYPEDAPEYMEAASRAALLPALFQEIHEAVGSSGGSDYNLRAFLAKRGFSGSAVDGAIRAYRDTDAFIRGLSVGYTGPSQAAEKEPTLLASGALSAGVRPSAGVPTPKSALSSEEFAIYPISKETRVRLIADGPVTARGIERLIQYLRLALDTMEDDPDDGDATQPQ